MITFLLAFLLTVTPPTPAPSAPVLSASESIALQALEEKKNDAAKAFQAASNAEDAVVAEFARNNPGYHLTPAPDFKVTKDQAK